MTAGRPFRAFQRLTEALKLEGFCFITEIDVKETFKKKLGIDFRTACNPALAHEALNLEDKVGTMLPCNVVVQEALGGAAEVAAIDLLPRCCLETSGRRGS